MINDRGPQHGTDVTRDGCARQPDPPGPHQERACSTHAQPTPRLLHPNQVDGNAHGWTADRTAQFRTYAPADCATDLPVRGRDSVRISTRATIGMSDGACAWRHLCTSKSVWTRLHARACAWTPPLPPTDAHSPVDLRIPFLPRGAACCVPRTRRSCEPDNAGAYANITTVATTVTDIVCAWTLAMAAMVAM